MSDLWVVNASPLILLAKVNQLQLLDQLTDSFVVPNAVVAEILAGPTDDPARLFLEMESVNTVTTQPHPLVVTWDLGAGETAVLSNAFVNPPCKAIVDDRTARRCAQTLSIPFAGTLAIILAARQKNLIPAAGPVLQDLLSHGYRIHESILSRVLWETLGEKWT